MAGPTVLRETGTGKEVTLQEGESADITFVPKDMTGAAILKANILTLTVVLYNFATKAAINSRGPTPQNVLDANGGLVATDGTLTLRLQAADNPIVGTLAAGKTETHCLEFAWTWSDGVLTRTAKSGPQAISVEKLATVT